MKGVWGPGARPSPTTVVRWFLVAACLAAAIPVVWRVGEVASELDRGERAAAAYRLGMDLHAKGRLDEAADAFRNAIALSPRMLDAHRGLARLEAARGRHDEAIAAYRQIMGLYPFSRLSFLYREVGLIELRADRLDGARVDLLQAAAIDPHDWRAHTLLGQVYQRQGDVERAEAALRRARELRDVQQSRP